MLGLLPSRRSCLLGFFLQQVLLPSLHADTLMDYLDVDNMPTWCRGCEKPNYLRDLRIAIADNLYSPTNWMMLGVWSVAAHEVNLGYLSTEVARRLSLLVGVKLSGVANWAIGTMQGNHPHTKVWDEIYSPYLWEPESSMVLDSLSELFLPLLVEKNGQKRLAKKQLGYFIEALSTSQHHISRPADTVSQAMLEMSGFRRAARLEKCWASGDLDPLEAIAARRDREYARVSVRKGVAYVFNPKVASSALRQHLSRDPGGMAPSILGRSAFPRLTWFSFVRDPLKRMVAGFFEIHNGENGHDLCEDYDHSDPARSFCGVGMSPFEADVDSEAHRAAVLRRFDAVLAAIEDGVLLDEHMALQTDRLVLLPERGGTIDFIGDFSTMRADWRDLGRIQRAVLNISLGPLPPRCRVTESSLYKILNISSLPSTLLRRVCQIYRKDYCCLDLPIPLKCRRTLTC